MEREEIQKRASTQSEDDIVAAIKRDNGEGESGDGDGDERMDMSDSNDNTNIHATQDKVEENFGDLDRISSIEKQKSLSDDILLSCNQDEQMSIWLQFEEENRKKMIMNEERETLAKISVPIPENNTLTVEQQQMIFDFMDTTSFEDTSIIYGFLLEKKWDLQAALDQYNAIKQEFAGRLEKGDAHSKHDDITDID